MDVRTEVDLILGNGAPVDFSYYAREHDHCHRAQQPGEESRYFAGGQDFVRGQSIEEGMPNRVEAVIRAFDPCLSCSTHALGRRVLCIELRAPDGALLDRVTSGRRRQDRPKARGRAMGGSNGGKLRSPGLCHHMVTCPHSVLAFCPVELRFAVVTAETLS